MLTSNEGISKIEKTYLKNIDKFFYSLTDEPVFDKGLVLPDKPIHPSKTCVKS